MKIKTMVSQFIVAALFLVAITAFAQELPAPGTTIDKSNYKKYQHLFPEELAPAFENGFGGVIQPIRMNVVATKKATGMPKAYLDLSAKNRGKYSIDANGNVTPAFTASDGMPFPDLKKGDKDFLIKFMWNQYYTYDSDDYVDVSSNSYTRRKGEPAILNGGLNNGCRFVARIVDAPKPTLQNPLGLYRTLIIQMLRPESVRNTMTMMYRYTDPNKPDDTYLYLPAMRRVLRAESSQRSSPIQGTIVSLDDVQGFDGRVQNFTYTLVEEKKALIIMDQTKLRAAADTWKKGELPWHYDEYMLRDVYVIDIKPKDPRYPQSRKRVYVDKENYHNYHVVAWDRAGKVWKVWTYATTLFPTPGGDVGVKYNTYSGVDVQFGMGNTYVSKMSINNNKLTYGDFTPAALLKRAR